MVEEPSTHYPISLRCLEILGYLMAGATLAQALGCIAAHLSMEDSQAAGMLADLLMQHLSYYFLGCAFLILSLSNLLIKRGTKQLKGVRLPSLCLIFSVAFTSYLLIPRMDYLRETALQDGMPVMLSPFANYFFILKSLGYFLLCVQIFSCVIMAWRLSNARSPQMSTHLPN